MKRMIAVFVILLLVCGSVSAFAEETKKTAHPNSGFNLLGHVFSNLGKNEDGKSVWDFEIETKKSTLSAEEIKEKRRSTGVMSSR